MDSLFPPPPPPPPLATTLPTTTTTTEPPHAANATLSVPQSFNHPSYTDMIYAAITTLKERGGSSKEAIGKYIESVYGGLPPNHPALLAHHLKRMKTNGLLVMLKKSYTLPPPASSPVAAAAMPQSLLGTLSVGPKRARGRPPKTKPSSQPEPVCGFDAVTQQVGGGGQTGLPFAGDQEMPGIVPGVTGMDGGGAQPVLVALGLAEDPEAVVRRRPGRPKKDVGQGGQVAVGKSGTGRPRKKSVGRPRKPKSVTGVMGSNGVKKGPGRPPKNQPTSAVGTVTYVPGSTVITVPRARGRPKKAAGLAAGGVSKVVRSPKRAGRPPKVGMVGRPKKSRGRPLGRPKMMANASWTTQPHAEEYGDLKQKLDFFQSKVKQAVGFLRPLVTPEIEPNIASAILELEGLVSMELNMPLREEPQPQLPPS